MSATHLFGSIGRFVLIIACLALALMLVVILLPIQLDVTPIKGLVEGVLTEFVEAPVAVDGFKVRLSLWPTLLLRDVSVAGSGEEGAPRFTQVDQVELKLSLLPLLGKELRLQKLHATGLTFHAHRRDDQPGNWPVWTTYTYEISELEDLDLQDIVIEFDDRDLGQGQVLIDRLSGSIGADRPLVLDLNGSYRELPLSIAAEGPTISDLTPQAADFPLTAELRLGDLRIDLEGSASREPETTDFDLALRVGADTLEFLRELAELQIPETGGFELAGRLSKQGGVLTTSELTGIAGETAVAGSLSLDVAGERLRLGGRIDLDRFDLAPWLAERDLYRSDSSSPLPWESLRLLDMDLVVSLGNLAGLEYDLEEIEVRARLERGTAWLPLSLRVADIPLGGELRIETKQEAGSIAAEIVAREVDLSQLDSFVEVGDAIAGGFGEVTLRVTASGSTLDELEATAMVRIDLDDSSFNIDDPTGEMPIELELRRATVVQRPRQSLQLAARGRLVGEDFTLQAETSPISELLRSNVWPAQLIAEGAGAEIDLDGTLERLGGKPSLDVQLLISGERVGDLSEWLGVSSAADLPYRIRGRLQVEDSARSLNVEEAAIGRSVFKGRFDWDVADEQRPTVAGIVAETVDPSELRQLFDPVTELDSEEDRLGFDLPVLPTKVQFGNADLDLTVDRLLRETVDLTQVQASFSFRDGRLERSPFSFRYETDVYEGKIALDLTSDVPSVALAVTGGSQDMGRILSGEEILSDFRATIDLLELDLSAQGSSLGQLVRTAVVTGRLEGLSFQLPVPEREETLEVLLDRVELRGPAGEPIVVTAHGAIDGEPLSLELELPIAEQSTEGPEAEPFRLRIEIADATADVEGSITLPLEGWQPQMQVQVSGEHLASLSSLLEKELPEVGPYRLAGRLSMTDRIYSLTDLEILVGESEVSGLLRYDAGGARPSVLIDLQSPQIRTQDLIPAAETPEPEANAALGKETLQMALESKPFIDSMQGLDVTVSMEIDRIVTSNANLQSLAFEARLADGYLDILAQQSPSDGEPIQFVIDVDPADEGIVVSFRTRWDRQPYGVLADLIFPEEKRGSWSADVDLRSRGSSIAELLANSSGHLDFTDYPDDFSATIFDLWGSGLVNSLLPVVKLGEESRLNCAIGRFTVSDGLMKPDALMIDSTRSRVRGKGVIDLTNQQLDLRMRPRPKQRSLITLAMPVRVKGPLEDPSINLTTGGAALTYFRISLWVYTVWRDLFRKPLPADGSDICLDPPPR